MLSIQMQALINYCTIFGEKRSFYGWRIKPNYECRSVCNSIFWCNLTCLRIFNSWFWLKAKINIILVYQVVGLLLIFPNCSEWKWSREMVCITWKMPSWQLRIGKTISMTQLLNHRLTKQANETLETDGGVCLKLHFTFTNTQQCWQCLDY